MKPYAWIIDHDLLNYARLDSCKDVTGPSGAPEDLLSQLRADGAAGTRFLVQDGEGQPVYLGRFIHLRETPDDKGDDWFAPLDQFGRPKANCTSIYYQASAEDFHAWVML